MITIGTVPINPQLFKILKITVKKNSINFKKTYSSSISKKSDIVDGISELIGLFEISFL